MFIKSKGKQSIQNYVECRVSLKKCKVDIRCFETTKKLKKEMKLMIKELMEEVTLKDKGEKR